MIGQRTERPEGGRLATFAAGEDEGDGAAIPLAVEVELIGEAAA